MPLPLLLRKEARSARMFAVSALTTACCRYHLFARKVPSAYEYLKGSYHAPANRHMYVNRKNIRKKLQRKSKTKNRSYFYMVCFFFKT